MAELVSMRGRRLAARWPALELAAAVEGAGARAAGSWRATGWSEGPGPLYLIYSVTKPLVAFLVLRLAERGLVDLDAPLARWLPEAPHAEQVTPRQLLRHTSGMPDYGPLPAYHEAVRRTPWRPWSDDEFLSRAVPGPLEFAPDGGWSYSNVGYLLLRQLVERAEGASLAQAFAREVATPLALPAARVAASLHDLDALAPGFSTHVGPGDDELPADVRGRYHPGWVAHGVVAATAPEVARTIHALLAGELLSHSSREALTTSVRVPVEHPRFVAPSYALGLMVDPAAPRGPTFGHTGDGPGYGAAAYHAQPASGAPPTTVAVLGNADVGGEMEGLALELLDALVEE
jgi:D-alanyl-D-alanine carboxypeptidase